MVLLEDLFIDIGSTIPDALAQLDRTGRGILLVVDSENRFVGTLTDGDVRRSLLQSGHLHGLVSDAVQRNATSLPPSRSLDAIKVAKQLRLEAIPVVDGDGRIVDCIFTDDKHAIAVNHGSADVPVVMMAGGLGRDSTRSPRFFPSHSFR